MYVRVIPFLSHRESMTNQQPRAGPGRALAASFFRYLWGDQSTFISPWACWPLLRTELTRRRRRRSEGISRGRVNAGRATCYYGGAVRCRPCICVVTESRSVENSHNKKRVICRLSGKPEIYERWTLETCTRNANWRAENDLVVDSP